MQGSKKKFPTSSANTVPPRQWSDSKDPSGWAELTREGRLREGPQDGKLSRGKYGREQKRGGRKMQVKFTRIQMLKLNR